MKKNNNNIIKYISHTITFVFFLWFIYFSYFAIKELLVLKYVTPAHHAAKFKTWDFKECNNPYSYKLRNHYSDEAHLQWLSPEEKNEKILENNKKVTDACLKELYKQSDMKIQSDFQYNFIKYILATWFFLILFIWFILQNYLMYRKNDK